MKYSGRKGWQAGYRDTFCLNHTLAPVIKAGLEKFYEVVFVQEGDNMFKKSVPMSLYPEGFDFNKDELTDEQYAIIRADYKTKVEKMIAAFDLEAIEKFHDELLEQYPINSEESAKYVSDMIQKKDSQILEGRELFAKHLADLWW